MAAFVGFPASIAGKVSGSIPLISTNEKPRIFGLGFFVAIYKMFDPGLPVNPGKKRAFYSNAGWML